MRNAWIGILLLAGCAAEGVLKPEADEIGGKSEALLGASCTEDAGCAAWEYCDRLLCIPERPCPAAGVCQDVTRFWDFEGTEIPDADAAGVTRTLNVLRPDATLASLHVDVSIDHTYRGDLQVVLRAPSGTEVVLHDRTGGSADGLSISRAVDELVGQSAAGGWQLVVRDLARADVGHIQNWNLSMTYAPIAPPEPTRNVWSQVTLDSTESAHPYTNRLNSVWDLRPYTGAATRARIHFTSIDVERNYDFVEVIDANSGALLDRFTGQLSDLTTREYDTAALQVRLRTDASVVRYGFRADRVDVFGAGCTADSDCGPGRTCDDSIVCVRAPCFSQCVASEPAVCTNGETMNDGCNTCSCLGGAWACTKRFCPPTSGEGEACGLGVGCAEGLVCDRGTTEEAAECGGDRAGVCLTTEPRFCRALYAPVCNCNGQTFPNECGRQGQGDWAHAGRCELSLSIPDANANGVRHTIHVTTPGNARRVRVEVEIDHTYRGDLVVWIEAPDGTRHTLTNREGGAEDDFTYAGTIELAGSPLGAWTLVATDRAPVDLGVLRFVNVIGEQP
jgi:subtilisin-like proprotein convertase family protein